MNDAVQSLRGFAMSRSGTIMPLFGLLLIPTLIIVGATMDFANAYSLKAKLQRVLDAATTAVCSTQTEATPEQVIRSFLDADFSGRGVSLLPAADQGPEPTVSVGQVKLKNAQFDPTTGTIAPELETKAPTTLLKLIGINDIDLGISSEVGCAGKRLELSLVLDVTGSMDDSIAGKKKIDSLKEAAQDVLDIFRTGMARGSARLALVPFSSAVNVGNLAADVRGVTEGGVSETQGRSKIRFRLKNDYDTLLEWNVTQCVSERLGPEAYTDAPPGCNGNSCSAPVGHVYTPDGACPVGPAIVPLTSDANTIETAINSYTAGGSTAGHIGTAWGWYLISNRWSSLLPAGAQPEPGDTEELIKATIIMTDGQFNTQYYEGVSDEWTWHPANNGLSQDQFDQLCAKMKDPDGDGVYNNDDVIVYTIGFGIGENSPEGSRLKSCATDNTKYFFPYDGDDLRATFVTIGKELAGGQSGFPLVRN